MPKPFGSHIAAFAILLIALSNTLVVVGEDNGALPDQAATSHEPVASDGEQIPIPAEDSVSESIPIVECDLQRQPQAKAIKKKSARKVRPSTIMSEKATRRMNITVLDVPDVARLMAEDSQATGGPPRVGVPIFVSLSNQDRETQILDNGQFWSHEFQANEAERLRLHFHNVQLPANAELYVYSPGHPEIVYGPYTGTGPFPEGSFWSPTVPGDSIGIEYYNPMSSQLEPIPFEIEEVAYIYNTGPCGTADWCHNDAMCYSTWSDLTEAVAQYLFTDDSDSNSYCCTGTLLANQAQDYTPYFLTAYHCVSSNTEAQSVEATWDWRTDSCGGSVPSFGSRPKSNDATFLAGSSTTDFSFLMIEGSLPTGGDITWSGWTTADLSLGE